MAAKIAGVFQPTLQDKVNNCKVLVVGAGGIGCEVLKNLVMSGFGDIEIVSNWPSLEFHNRMQQMTPATLCDHTRLYKFSLFCRFRLIWTPSMSAT